MNDITRRMNERMEKWKDNSLPVPSATKLFGKSCNTRKDTEDDDERYRRRELEEWNKEIENSMYGRK